MPGTVIVALQKIGTKLQGFLVYWLSALTSYLHDAISLMFQNLNGGTLCLGQIKGTAYESIHADFREIHLSHGSWGNDTIKKIL